MRRILAFLLLLNHINTSMLLPQVPEVDVYDANGNQVDDINSVFEYVMVNLGYDHHADDEDDDCGQNFHAASYPQYTFNPGFTEIIKDYPNAKRNLFPEYSQYRITNISYDIIVPPPQI
ncbi:MAG: hypothetical protein ABI123_00360 [Ginsengibacter sp.]